jgi:hypothetical protein
VEGELPALRALERGSDRDLHAELVGRMGLSLADAFDLWPAAGSVDTELRCLMELEVSNGETEVQPRVQA